MSIAVLTFQSRSRDTSDVFLAEGLADDIAARLGQVDRIVVRSREAVRRLPAADKMSMPDLGKQLNAAYILTGTVQPAGSRLRVIVELAKAQTSDVAWTSPFDRTRDDILSMQTEIASAVAGAVAGKLGLGDAKRVAAGPTTNAEAFTHIARGTAFLERRMLSYAAPEFREAVRLDPNSALAWARLSQTLAICASGSCGLDSNRVLRRDSRSAADRALALDTTSADTWLADGNALVQSDQPDLPAARISLERALRLNPRYAEAHHVLGYQLLRMGDNAGAVREYRAALAIDPGRAVTWEHLAQVAFDEGRWADAEAAADTALALGKDWAGALNDRWSAIMLEQNPARMRGLASRLGITDSIPTLYEDAYVRLAEHDTSGAGAVADRLRAAGERSTRLAVLLAVTGRRTEAGAMIKAFRPASAFSWHVYRSPAFAPLRDMPEWIAYVARAKERTFWTARK